MPYATNIVKEGEETILQMDLTGSGELAAIEESEGLMTRIIYALAQYRDVTRIQLAERRIYEYDPAQTRLLREIGSIIVYLRTAKEVMDPYTVTAKTCQQCVPDSYRFLQSLVFDLLPRDPIGAYLTLTRRIRHEEIGLQKEGIETHMAHRKWYLQLLNQIREMMEKTSLIRTVHSELEGYEVGDRTLYRKLFHPSVRPNFTFTRLMAQYPPGAEELTSYDVGDAKVILFRLPEQVRNLYHILPPEFKLTETQLMILDAARQVMTRHRPGSAELIEPERVRQSLHDISLDLIRDFSTKGGYELANSENEMLAEILTRETAGFGILELILADEKVQDVTINAPAGATPLSLYHGDVEDCQTNVIPTREEVESWAARLRLLSGRPLDQSNPVLDTSIDLPGARVRVAAITRPFSPNGLAFAFRRHRDSPWTLPLFIKNGFMTPLAAGLLSLFADTGRTILIAGTRSSGKTSLLGALMLEVMRRNRIITIEDTLELPINKLLQLNYNIQSLKVQSAISELTTELSAADGIRTSLRLGDSVLIIGEVRSKEALALYEAMRVGALANMVAGTIHGDSPYGVYDRLVNDLGVPPTSFKATDIIAVCNPIKTADGLHRVRRLVQLTEVRKEWDKDPIKEKGFADLLEYDAKSDKLRPTAVLTDGESEVISSLAARIKEWVGNFDAVWENINLRAKTKQTLVDFALSTGNNNLLEAPFVVRANDVFHLLSDEVRQEQGTLVSSEIYERWENWVKTAIKEGSV